VITKRRVILFLLLIVGLFPLVGEAQQQEASVFYSFNTFTRQWMEKLARAEEFRRSQRMVIKKTAEGFVAEYTGYQLPSRAITIKKTTSSFTPFIGILTYYEEVLRSFGRTREEAVQGPFKVTETREVMEVFRYTQGQWKY
jgi:hypothetical protein